MYLIPNKFERWHHWIKFANFSENCTASLVSSVQSDTSRGKQFTSIKIIFFWKYIENISGTAITLQVKHKIANYHT